ncbi:hypothetical protein [Alicyclobacillus macrosporangiidus]|uniref:hypothetical protein n=1 Tax=Alicyclobacillus macrosporangiidus TaxID=392015 RepID=UPI0012DDCFA2|nr:hypothetical protein [Alicyclobacillus macrosporangiidus]
MKTSIPEEGVHLTTLMNSYWNARYANGRIWGDDPCPSALMANEHFRSANVKDLLVPGCGYGRNSVFFAEKGYRVTAFDVSDVSNWPLRRLGNVLSTSITQWGTFLTPYF